MKKQKKIYNKLNELQSGDLNKIIDVFELDFNKNKTNNNKIEYIQDNVEANKLYKYLFGSWYKKISIVLPLFAITLATGGICLTIYFQLFHKSDVAKDITTLKTMFEDYSLATKSNEIINNDSLSVILNRYKITEKEILQIAKERQHISSDYNEKAWASISLGEQEKGLEFLKLAAHYGYPAANYNLGVYYSKFEEDNKTAASYFAKAIEKDYDQAIRALAQEQIKSENFDTMEVKKLLDVAIEKDSTDACAYLYKSKIETDSIYELSLIQKASHFGCSQGQFLLATFYQYGLKGLEVDKSKAFQLYNKSAKQNYSPAISNLSQCYRLGIGVEANPKYEFQWTRKAASYLHPTDCGNLAILYYKGRGTPKNMEKSQYWFKIASIGDDDRAISMLNSNVFKKNKAYLQIQKPTTLTKKEVESFYNIFLSYPLNTKLISTKYIETEDIQLEVDHTKKYVLTFSESEGNITLSVANLESYAKMNLIFIPNINVVDDQEISDIKTQIYNLVRDLEFENK